MKLIPVNELPKRERRERFNWLHVFNRLKTEFPGQWVRLGRKYKNPASAHAAVYQAKAKYAHNGHAQVEMSVRGGTIYLKWNRSKRAR